MVDLRQNAELRSLFERDGEHLLPVYARYPAVMEGGEGVYLFESSHRLLLPEIGHAASFEAITASV